MSAARFTLPANYFSIGKKMRVRSSGRISTVVTTPGTLTLDLRFGASTVSGLPLCPQDTGEAGLAGDIHALISQHGHDARWRHGCKSRLVGHAEHPLALDLAQGMSGRRAHRLGPAIPLAQALLRIPAL